MSKRITTKQKNQGKMSEIYDFNWRSKLRVYNTSFSLLRAKDKIANKIFYNLDGYQVTFLKPDKFKKKNFSLLC